MRNHLSLGIVTLFMLALCSLWSAPLLAADGPTFQIVQPMADQTVTGTKLPIAITFQGSDDAPIVRFEAYLDSTWLVSGRIRNPIVSGHFRVEGDLAEAKIKPGVHTLYLKVFDNQGRVAQQEQRITVQVATASAERNAPHVRITSPQDGAQITSKTNIKVEATDDSGIKWVMVYINGQMRAMMNEPPFSVPWDPIRDRLENGPYRLSARALDIFDNEADSGPVTVIVMNRLSGDGRTPLQKDPEQNSETMVVPGVFPVAQNLWPFAGARGERWLSSNTLLPSRSWLPGPGGLLPDLIPQFARDYFTPQPLLGGDALALLPVAKLLPGQTEMASVLLPAPRGTTLSPVLAALPGMRTSVLGMGTLTPYRVGQGLLPLPAMNADRQVGEAQPILLAAVPVMEKAMPSTSREVAVKVDTTPVAGSTVTPRTGASAGRVTANAAAPHADRTLLLPDEAARAIRAAMATDQPVLVAWIAPTMEKYTPEKVVATAIPAEGMPAARASVATPAPAAGSAADRLAASPTRPVAMADVPAPLLIAKVPARDMPANTPNPALTTELPEKTSPSPSLAVADQSGDMTIDDLPLLIARAETAVPATALQGEARHAGPSAAPSVRSEVTANDSLLIDTMGPYTVKQEDTLTKIARAYSTTPETLIKMNPGISPDRPLPVGANMVVPAAARLYLDDTPLAGGPDPYIVEGFSMVPLRQLIEAKDGKIVWLPATREVNAWVQQTFLGVKVGSRQARINEQAYQLPVAAEIREARTMVPLRYIMAALQLKLEYNPASGTYYLASTALPNK